MKLVEINDIRPGQVWQFGENMCRPVRKDEVTFYEDQK